MASEDDSADVAAAELPSVPPPPLPETAFPADVGKESLLAISTPATAQLETSSVGVY